jgi:hypothetical protein
MIAERLELDESREVSHESRAVTSPDKLEVTGDAGRIDPNERHFVTDHLQPLKELLIATPSGLLAGAAFIFVYVPARRVALNLFSIL